MYDNSLYFSNLSENQSTILKDLKIDNEPFILSTVHRNDNTDDSIKINQLFSTFLNIVANHNIKIVLPLHPRTAKMMDKLLEPSLKSQVENSTMLKVIPPASFLDIIALEKNAQLVITDSGGVQKEAYFFKKPCIILRPQTEWVEIVATKSAVIADTDPEKILAATKSFLMNSELSFPPVFGDGNAAKFIAEEMINQFS